MEKRRYCSLGAISSLSHNILLILLPVVSFSCFNRDILLLRDKPLFETSEVDITRVDCNFMHGNSV